MTTTPPAIRVRARLDGEPNRGLWPVKWLLLIPHFIVLSLLWMAFTVLTLIAFFAIRGRAGSLRAASGRVAGTSAVI
jgi:hypothetical protein